MTGYIKEKATGKIIATIENHLPYGMTFAKGGEVFTIVFSLDIVNKPKKGIKACANAVFTMNGWTKRTHELIIE